MPLFRSVWFREGEAVITSVESKIHDKSKDARTPVGKHDDNLHC